MSNDKMIINDDWKAFEKQRSWSSLKNVSNQTEQFPPARGPTPAFRMETARQYAHHPGSTV